MNRLFYTELLEYYRNLARLRTAIYGYSTAAECFQRDVLEVLKNSLPWGHA